MERGDLDRRTYDLLRLVNENEPIGSIRLVDRLQQRGYDIKDRTVRLTLSELDEAGLTKKVAGKGRRLTAAGREELARGDVGGRLANVRERIATLTSQVTYDPAEDLGELIAGAGLIATDDIEVAFDHLERLHESSVGPALVSVDRTDAGVRLAVPSSITLDGVLLSRGIDARLVTAGLVEYDGSVRRYIDAISGEDSTMDVVHLLVEAGCTDVQSALDGEMGVLIVDNREFPLPRFEEARDLSAETRKRLGGVLDIRRPRESGPLPGSEPSWEFASLTYGGFGETALALLAELDLLQEWDSLAGLRPRGDFEPVPALRERHR
jgi:repressor of nif and glnA expression